MLAIFDKSVAACPDNFEKPHHNSVSALKNSFLVKHFALLHPDSVATDIGASAVFSCSRQLITHNLWFRFGEDGDISCMYEGYMDNLDSLQKQFLLNPLDDEVNVVIQVFKILQELGHQTPESVFSRMVGDFSFIVYDRSSKLIFLTSVTSGDFTMFWGIDSESSLIVSDDAEIVKKACGAIHSFPTGKIYISRRGHGGLEAIFQDYKAEEVEHQPPETDTTSQTITRGNQIGPQIESWQPPPRYFFKINTQGVSFPHKKMVGIGVIVRNSHGQMILAGSKKVKGFTSCIHAQGLASVEGLKLALESGFRNVIWESLRCYIEDSAFMRCVTADMALLRENFSSFEVSDISLNANKAAYGLAEYAMVVEDSIVWLREIPECIDSVLEMETHRPA